MSILVNKPQNTNPLQPTKFLLSFTEIPDTVYFCQKVNIPGLSTPEIVQATPNINLYRPSTQMTYELLEFDFLVNEDMTAWTQIYDWLRDNGTGNFRKTNSQATLTILSNLNNPKIRIKYINVYPTSLSSLQLDTTLSAEEHIAATVKFRFDTFEIEFLN